MNTNMGVWIDHRRAVIVSLVDAEPTVVTIASEVERHARSNGGSRSANPTGPQDVVSESQRDEKYHHHLESFYSEVQRAVEPASGIFILGPGEAKYELEKHLRKTKALKPRIALVESADKLTQPQLVAKVRAYFTAMSV